MNAKGGGLALGFVWFLKARGCGLLGFGFWWDPARGLGGILTGVLGFCLS